MIEEILVFLKYHLLLVIFCVSIFIFGVFLEYMEWFYSYNISPKEAINIMNHKNGFVLDLRLSYEYKKEHIIYSENYDIKNFVYNNKNKIYIERNIILILNTKQDCKYVIQKLNLFKFKKVKCLKNGITGWKSLKLPVIKNI